MFLQKHLLGIEKLSTAEINVVLDLAEKYAELNRKKALETKKPLVGGGERDREAALLSCSPFSNAACTAAAFAASSAFLCCLNSSRCAFRASSFCFWSIASLSNAAASSAFLSDAYAAALLAVRDLPAVMVLCRAGRRMLPSTARAVAKERSIPELVDAACRAGQPSRTRKVPRCPLRSRRVMRVLLPSRK